MALTTATAVDRIYRLAKERGIELRVEDIESSIPDALQALAEMVAGSTKHNRLVKTATAAMTSGVAALSSITDRLDGQGNIRRVSHSNGDTVSLLPIGSTQSDLKYERGMFYDWAVLEANSLYLMTGDGATPPDDDTLTILYSYVPIITTVPTELEDDFIEIAVGKAARVAAAA